MTEKQLDIFNKITSAYDELNNCFDPATFVLRPQAQEIMQRIAALQAQCEHEFVNGKCIICGLRQNEVEAPNT